MKNEVSLCMIVKNEDKYLPQCLNSVKDIVDEMIIVDTGSTDKTVEIAKSFGAKVYFFPWNNSFSDARNESLKYASKDWILILDADDELKSESQKNLIDLLNRDLDENIVYNFETLNYYGDVIDDTSITVNLNPRLFKNNHGLYYEGEVHNQLILPQDSHNGIYNSVKIHHYGYLTKTVKSKNKKNRTISLLKEQLKKDPDNYFAYFNLGTEYAYLNENKKALKCYYKSYEKFDPLNGYSFLLILRIVVLNHKIKDFDNALKFIDIGIKHYPKFTDLYFFKALIFRDMGMPTLQIKSLEKCIELGEAPSQLKCFYGTGSFKAYYELGNTYLKLKDYTAAHNYYVESMKYKTDFVNPLYHISYILKTRNTPLEEFKKIMESFLPDCPNSTLILIDLFYNEGYYEDVLNYIEKYQQTSVITEDLILLKAKCLLMCGHFNECLAINNKDKESSLYLHFSMYKVLSNLLINDLDNALVILNSFKEDTLSQCDKKLFKVYSQFINLLKKEPASDLSNVENEAGYLNMILEICEILLLNNRFDEFKIAVNLLNLINNKFILLELGKLYYKWGYIDFAKKEILRSIKEFEVYDNEGLGLLIN